MIQEPHLEAGDFSAWIVEIQAAIAGERASDVPCGTCTACCTSSQFIHIAPDETDALAHIPQALLFPAPRLPAGHVLMGYNEHGHCPMLIGNRCTIYEHRPRTCRTYDCRVFPAAGLEPDEADKALIAEQARRWQFSYPTEIDEVLHDAVRSAAAFLQEHAYGLPEGVLTASPTQLAVLAIEMHGLFLATGDRTEAELARPDEEAVRVELSSRRSIPRPRRRGSIDT